MRKDLLSIYMSELQFGYYMQELNKSYHIDEGSQDIKNNVYNFVVMATFSFSGLSKVIQKDGCN